MNSLLQLIRDANWEAMFFWGVFWLTCLVLLGFPVAAALHIRWLLKLGYGRKTEDVQVYSAPIGERGYFTVIASRSVIRPNWEEFYP